MLSPRSLRMLSLHHKSKHLRAPVDLLPLLASQPDRRSLAGLVVSQS